MVNLTPFEEAVLDALLAGDAPILEQLRKQRLSATASSRDLSGSGFFLNFEAAPHSLSVAPPNFEIGDLYFESADLPAGGEAILFVRAGKIECLEVFSHDGSWPNSITTFELKYFDVERDTAGLLRQIQARTEGDWPPNPSLQRTAPGPSPGRRR